MYIYRFVRLVSVNKYMLFTGNNACYLGPSQKVGGLFSFHNFVVLFFLKLRFKMSESDVILVVDYNYSQGVILIIFIKFN